MRGGIVGCWHLTRKDPKYLLDWIGLGNACKINGLIDDAIEAFKSALELEPDSTKALLRLGETLEMKGDIDGVNQLYEPLIKARRASRDIYIHYGRIFLRQNKIDNAMNAFKKALNLDLNNPEALAHFAIALFLKGEKKALETFWEPLIPTKDIKSEPGEDFINKWLTTKLNTIGKPKVDWKKIAEILLESNEFDTCINFMECILTHDLDNIEAISRLASCYLGKRNYRSALKVAQHGLAKNSLHVDLNVIAGISYAAIGDLASASKILRNYPNNYKARAGLRDGYIQFGNQDQVDMLTEELLVNESTPVPALIYMLSGPMTPRMEERAIHALERRLSHDPGFLQGWLLLSCFYASCSRRDDAINSLQKILVLYPAFVPAILALNTLNHSDDVKRISGDLATLLYKPGVDDHLIQSKFLEMLDDLNGSLTSLKAAHSIVPTNKNVFYQMIHVFSKLNDAESAISACKDAVDIDDRDPAPWYIMGTHYFNIKNLDAAIEAFSEALARNPSDTSTLVYTGCSWLLKGDLSKATQMFIAATKINSHYYPALVFLDKVFHRLSDTRETEHIQERIASLVPSMYEYFETSFCAANMQELELASRNYAALLKKNPGAAGAWNNYALILEKQGDFRQAIDGFQKSIENDPRGFHAWTNLALTKDNMGDIAGAIDVYEEFSRRFPTNEKGWFSKGQILLDEKNIQDAAIAFGKAVEVRPDFHNGWSFLGIAHVLARQIELAKEAIEYAVGLAPSNPLANALAVITEIVKENDDQVPLDARIPEPLNIQDSMDLCHGLDALGWLHEESAIGAWQKNTTRFPYNDNAWFGLGQALEKHGDLDEAERMLKRAIEINPYHYKSIATLGRVLAKRGRDEEARGLLEHLTKTYPDFIDGWGELARASLILEPVDMDGASRALDKASSMRADDIDVLQVRAIQILKLKRFDECMDVIETIIGRDKDLRHIISTDAQFREIEENPRFKKLTSEEEIQ